MVEYRQDVFTPTVTLKDGNRFGLSGITELEVKNDNTISGVDGGSIFIPCEKEELYKSRNNPFAIDGVKEDGFCYFLMPDNGIFLSYFLKIQKNIKNFWIQYIKNTDLVLYFYKKTPKTIYVFIFFKIEECIFCVFFIFLCLVF